MHAHRLAQACQTQAAAWSSHALPFDLTCYRIHFTTGMRHCCNMNDRMQSRKRPAKDCYSTCWLLVLLWQQRQRAQQGPKATHYSGFYGSAWRQVINGVSDPPTGPTVDLPTHPMMPKSSKCFQLIVLRSLGQLTAVVGYFPTELGLVTNHTLSRKVVSNLSFSPPPFSHR